MEKWQSKYERWKQYEALEVTLKNELHNMDETQKEDAFYRDLEFGTAGMRGILGPGTNRMNIYTIRKANAGFARYISKQGEDAKMRGIVIAYDSRKMSKEFAAESAKVMASYGVKAYVFEDLRPTPQLSFAVRRLGAIGGIVITASHNPKEYNGYKIYDQDGCQCVPEIANLIVTEVLQIPDEFSIPVAPLAEYVKAGLVVLIGPEIDAAYTEAICQTSFAQVPKDDLKVVYTALHGTGYLPTKKVFDALGYHNIYYVESQCLPDPDFTTVPIPNPEDTRVFDEAKKIGKIVDADILLATDPDADRLGIAIKAGLGQYELLNGNMTGALMTYYILDRLRAEGKLASDSVLFTTIVSSDFAEVIARSFGVTTERTLTGFKFIGQKIAKNEKINGPKFIFGFEESYGSLVNAQIARDKDAIQAVVILTEMAAFYKAQGQSLLSIISQLEQHYGVFYEELENINLSGKEGAQKIQYLMNTIAQHPFTVIDDKTVTTFENYLTRQRVSERGMEPIALPAAEVLKFYLSDGSWFCIRPSGTEPKAKIYIAVQDQNSELAKLKASRLKATIMEHIDRILQE